jgi:hypothetical protein
MTSDQELRRIFEADQAGMAPCPTQRQSHDRVLTVLVQGLKDAEASGDRAAVRTYCQFIDGLKRLFPSIYPSWNRPSRYWRRSEDV